MYTYEHEKKNKIHNIESYEATQVQNAYSMGKSGDLYSQ